MTMRDSFEVCYEAKKGFNEEHEEVLKLSFQQSLSSGNGWNNETMSDQTLAVFANRCEADGGRFTASEYAILDCTIGKIGYSNVGDCFPAEPACAVYTLGTFVTAMSNKKLKQKCSLQTEVMLDHIPELSPTPAPMTLPPIPDEEINSHSDDQRMACQQSTNEYFNGNTAFDQATSSYFNALGTATSKVWNNQTFPSAATQLYGVACKNQGGRFETFTGTLDCIGFGEFNKKRVYRGYINYGQCFAPGRACDVYENAGAWLIDFNWVWHYDCKVASVGMMMQEKPPDSSDIHESHQQTSLPKLGQDDATNKARSIDLHPYLLLMVTIAVIAFAVYVAQRRWNRRNSYAYDQANLDLEMTAVQSGFD